MGPDPNICGERSYFFLGRRRQALFSNEGKLLLPGTMLIEVLDRQVFLRRTKKAENIHLIQDKTAVGQPVFQTSLSQTVPPVAKLEVEAWVDPRYYPIEMTAYAEALRAQILNVAPALDASVKAGKMKFQVQPRPPKSLETDAQTKKTRFWRSEGK